MNLRGSSAKGYAPVKKFQISFPEDGAQCSESATKHAAESNYPSNPVNPRKDRSMSPLEDPRPKMVEIAHLMYDRFMTNSAGGNLSCRIGDRI